MKIFFTFLLLLPIITFSQNTVEEDLDSILTSEAAASYLKNHKSKKGKLLTFNKEKHKTRLASDLFQLSTGGKKTIKNDFKTIYYKVINKSSTPHYRVSYIYFDGNTLTQTEIDDKRKKIIGQYKDGYNFGKLAKLHSMDASAKRSGDLGWLTMGKMHQEFEDAVKTHKVNDIYSLDISDRPWHYVVLKTYDIKYIEEIEVLKITETIN